MMKARVEQNFESSCLGKLLVDKGWINEHQLKLGLHYQVCNGGKLGDALVAMHYISPSQLKTTLRRQRWLRWLAGVLMVVSPISPVWATDKLVSEKNTSMTYKLDWNDRELSPEYESKDSRYEPGIRFRISNSFGMTLGVSQSFNAPNWDAQSAFVPQVTFYVSDDQVQQWNSEQRLIPENRSRDDRYSRDLPAVFQLTLRGYSLFEEKGAVSNHWESMILSENPKNNVQLLFSVTQHF